MSATTTVPSADVAFVVDENYQGLGIASFLFEMLIRVAREQGIRRFTADVIADNKAMLKVFEKAPFPDPCSHGVRDL